ncbi:hypothetical protein ASE66_29255 [Bosea sp. Root483D1]|uniref:hypothetical protein n=1 Tax=Bosea sp. Root483D1 TaxID=1736544 RepID=UPI000709A9BD|nr:hypothetical protein [Bosea sp. Root483D1]KRE17557.1 hypothetical protein ASE66_29255 [Bosea sp. Root483D1]
MRDGQGNKLSPEEQQKVRSIQGTPDNESVSGVSIDPNAEKDTGEADKPKVPPEDKPAAGVGES